MQQNKRWVLAPAGFFSWASLENKPFPQPVQPGKIPEGAGGFNPLKESKSAVPSGTGH
jgi:hypothetical protein